MTRKRMALDRSGLRECTEGVGSPIDRAENGSVVRPQEVPVPSLHIVIPVFNRWEQTDRCLASLAPGIGSDYEVVVVDHGSTDATKTALPAGYPGVVHLLDSDELWWAGATNVGVRYALAHGAESIMLLNNDCIIGAGEVRVLESLAKRHGAIVAPVQRVLSTGQILAVTARSLVWLGFPIFREVRVIAPPAQEVMDVPLILGGRGVVIPRRAFETVGLFAEAELPHYWADQDFYMRCRRRGVRLAVAPRVDVLVDTETGSLANDLAGLGWRDVLEAWRSPRSHRNLRALAGFFRRHYPIRRLWPIGVLLNAARFGAVWLLARLRRLCSVRGSAPVDR